MQRKSDMWISARNEIKSHPVVYILLFIILLFAFFLRVYRVSDLMQFYYDQGRDALVIWDLWHKGKPFLIGPITGLIGIFLGPFFYYLIAPFYLIGGGDPAYPAVFLAFLTVCALGVMYYLGWQMQSRATGLIAVTIGGVSYYMVLAGRWLSNPTPILLTSVLLFLSLWKIITTKNDKWWLAVALLVGISMHFESASAIFYIPMVGAFFLWQIFENKNANAKLERRKAFSIYFFSILIFIFTLLPQLLFNFRHDNLLFNNFSKLFFQEKGFQLDIMEVLHTRLKYFWDVFASKIYHGEPKYRYFFTLFALGGLLYNQKSLTSQKVFPLFLIFLGVPMIGYILFQGNYGNMYDYYMTGYYLPMLLLFSLGLGALWQSPAGKIIVLVFFLYFLKPNLELDRNYLRAGVDGPTDVRLKSELQGVDWVYDNARTHNMQTFNTDVYVPPVIPHSYDYLFLWQGTIRQAQGCSEPLCGNVKEPQVETVYLLYEVDPPHPERLSAWLNRYSGNTIVEEQQKFGGVTVERRKRI